MEFDTIYRLKSVSDDTLLFFEDDSPYEHIEKSVLFWNDRLCIETYESDKGPDYDIFVNYYLFDQNASKKLLEHFGGLELFYEELRKGGIQGDFERISKSLGISPQRLKANPFVK